VLLIETTSCFKSSIFLEKGAGLCKTLTRDIQVLLGKDVDENEDKSHVYQLVSGPSMIAKLHCKSCDPHQGFQQFPNGIIYKYGTAIDRGTFESSVIKRYASEKSDYGFTDFSFIPYTNPIANVTAVNMTPYGPIPSCFKCSIFRKKARV
jgi:hypothetical protein